KGNACCKITTGGKNLSVYLKVYADKYEVWVAEAQGELATVTFTVDKAPATMGQAVYLMGDYCAWDITKAIRGEFVNGKWVIVASLPVGTTTGIKFVVAAWDNPSSVITWESGEDVSYTFDATKTQDWNFRKVL
ncbi:MAG: hypothetical protein MJ245_07745, partial [Clostridia bacterium]|nr:hypothetical protein [Clostridia bacterium]